MLDVPSSLPMSDPQPFKRLAFGDGDLLAEALPGGASYPTPRYGPGLTSRVVHGTFLNLGGQGVTMLATLLATPFAIRLLGAPGYGVLALVHVLIGSLGF